MYAGLQLNQANFNRFAGGGGGSGSVVVYEVENLAALKALPIRPEVVIVKTGQAAGAWQWVLGSVTTADDALVVNPTSGTAGRYKRIFTAGLYDVTWFGTTGDGTTNDRPAFAAADAAIVAVGGGQLHIPKSAYKLSTDFTFSSGVAVHIDAGTTFVTGALRGVLLYWDAYSPTAVAGSALECGSAVTSNENATYTLAALGAIWPGKVKALFGVSKGYVSADGNGATDYFLGQVNYVTNSNTSIDTVAAQLSVGHVIANGCRAFGANHIACAVAGTTSISLVGQEIDVEPGVGCTISGNSGGQFLVAFNVDSVGPAIQTAGAAGGTFSNGVIINAIAAAGAGVTDQAGLSCATLLNCVNGTYSRAAITMGPGQKTRYIDNSVAKIADVYTNGSAELVTEHQQGMSVVLGRDNTEGTTAFAVRSANGTHSILSYVATGGLWNIGANTALGVGGNSLTSRSINAWGTVNASGADYAEYERKGDDCGEIAKGQVVGFDEDGLLTTAFSRAVSFAVKSTNPNLVGGDTWHTAAGQPPVEPVPPLPPRARPEATETIRKSDPRIAAQIEADHAEAVRKWEADVDAYEAAMAVYTPLKEQFNKGMGEYLARHEAERQKVDRIAYCGKVPVNFYDAKPGQYLKAVEGSDDSIAIAIADSRHDDNIVGRVRRILDDSRAEIVVMG